MLWSTSFSYNFGVPSATAHSFFSPLPPLCDVLHPGFANHHHVCCGVQQRPAVGLLEPARISCDWQRAAPATPGQENLHLERAEGTSRKQSVLFYSAACALLWLEAHLQNIFLQKIVVSLHLKTETASLTSLACFTT